MNAKQIGRLIERKRQKIKAIYGAMYVLYSLRGLGEIVLLDKNKKPIDNLTHQELLAL